MLRAHDFAGADRTEGAIAVVGPVRLMSATSYLGTAIVIDDRFGYDGARDLKLFLTEAEVAIEPVTIDRCRSRAMPIADSGRATIRPP